MAEGDGEGEATGAHTGTSDVFISYASHDAAVANAAVLALERQSIKCWIAPRDVTPGALYADDIIRAINGAKVLVLVLSASSVASKHVGKEVERASSKGRPIVTLRIDAASLPPALEYFLSESQWIDLGTDGTEVAFAKLVTAVRGQMVPATGDGLAVRPTGYSFDRPSAIAGTSWIVVGAFVLLGAAIAWFAYDRFGSARRVMSSDHAAAVDPTAIPTPVTPPASPAPFTPPAHSVAVLPFVNMSGDSTQDYFSDGISEELLNALSRLDQLQVAARTSSFSFKGQIVDVTTIAHKLNVGAVLEGSIRRSGNTVRITAQLIDAKTGFHIWSQTYDRRLTDILRVQADVAASVAQQLKVTLVGDESAKLELGGTHNPDAYDSYLRGYQLVYSAAVTVETFRAATAAFDRAITLDPKYALAYAGRARTFDLYSIFLATHDERPRVQQQALAAAERAVALAPELGEAHLALGFTRGMDLFDLRGAAPEFDRALALAPGNAQVLRLYAAFNSIIGHHDQALTAAKRALSLDPQSVLAHLTLGRVFSGSREFDKALEAFQAARTLDPDSHYVESNMISALLGSGHFEQARQLCVSASTPLDQDSRHLFLAIAYHALGRKADAEHELSELKDATDNYAAIYAQWGDKRLALRWLAEAERQRSSSLQVLRSDWMLDPIRNDPQFKAIEARMNFPP